MLSGLLTIVLENGFRSSGINQIDTEKKTPPL
jgi:hypothetical protein